MKLEEVGLGRSPLEAYLAYVEKLAPSVREKEREIQRENAAIFVQMRTMRAESQCSWRFFGGLVVGALGSAAFGPFACFELHFTGKAKSGRPAS